MARIRPPVDKRVRRVYHSLVTLIDIDDEGVNRLFEGTQEMAINQNWYSSTISCCVKTDQTTGSEHRINSNCEIRRG